VGAVGDPVNTVVDNKSATAARDSPAAGPVLDASASGLLDTRDEALDGPDEGFGAPVDRLDGLDEPVGLDEPADLDEPVSEVAGDVAASDAAVINGAVINGMVLDAPVLDAPVIDGAALDGAVIDGAVIDGAVIDGAAPDSGADHSAGDEPALDGRAPGAVTQEDAAGQQAEQGHVSGNAGKSVNLGANGQPSDGDGRPIAVTAILSETAILPEIAPADEALAPDTFATSAFDAEGRRAPAVWAAADVVTEIYHGHYNQLVRLAVLLVHDVQTAEEVVQDAFEAMHLASRRLRDSEKALSYLRQTVVNRSRSVLRHRKVVDMHAPKPGPDEPSAEHAALAILERSAVAAALRTLPERQREAIALRYYADFSEADIAQAMGISKGAVKSHTARAMASLKTILTRETS
jgi:RNA polymerase sigma-70 factor (sigma-E family)